MFWFFYWVWLGNPLYRFRNLRDLVSNIFICKKLGLKMQNLRSDLL